MNRENWIRKKNRIKNKLNKSNNQYKLVVFRSNKHIYGQLLDTDKGVTVFSSSSLDKELEKEMKSIDSGKVEISKAVAKNLSSKMKKNKIETITFDRNGYIYHGRVKAFAEELRSNGIKF